MNVSPGPDTYQPIMNDPIPMQSALKLPFDVNNELNIYQRVYIAHQHDVFRIFQTCEVAGAFDYIVYGELPDGDKKILFTVKKHFKCCNCCDNCIISFGILEFACCNSILIQYDYQRNYNNFYNQGFYITQGCHCCKCYYLLTNVFMCPINITPCMCCFDKCIPKTYLMRENLDPENPDVNVGVKKGTTNAISCCGDKLVTYITQEGLKGPTVKLQCSEDCKRGCACYDIELIIEDANGQQTGTIYVPRGCCSKKDEGQCCMVPGVHFVINFPPNASSTEKFQIIADLIHFNEFNAVI